MLENCPLDWEQERKDMSRYESPGKLVLWQPIPGTTAAETAGLQLNRSSRRWRTFLENKENPIK